MEFWVSLKAKEKWEREISLSFTVKIGKDIRVGSLIQRCQKFTERIKSDPVICQRGLLEISRHLVTNSNHHTEHQFLADKESQIQEEGAKGSMLELWERERREGEGRKRSINYMANHHELLWEALPQKSRIISALISHNHAWVQQGKDVNPQWGTQYWPVKQSIRKSLLFLNFFHKNSTKWERMYRIWLIHNRCTLWKSLLIEALSQSVGMFFIFHSFILQIYGVSAICQVGC